jgi:hypothetical protein
MNINSQVSARAYTSFLQQPADRSTPTYLISTIALEMQQLECATRFEHSFREFTQSQHSEDVQKSLMESVISGFCRGVSEIVVLLGC